MCNMTKEIKTLKKSIYVSIYIDIYIDKYIYITLTPPKIVLQ